MRPPNSLRKQRLFSRRVLAVGNATAKLMSISCERLASVLIQKKETKTKTKKKPARQPNSDTHMVFQLEGLGAPGLPRFLRRSNFQKTLPIMPLFKVCILCTLPTKFPPVMRIPMPNPMGSGDHPGPLI